MAYKGSRKQQCSKMKDMLMVTNLCVREERLFKLTLSISLDSGFENQVCQNIESIYQLWC